MTTRFDPAVDWPGQLPTGAYDPNPIAMAACAIVEQEFPIAYRTCLVEKWMRQSAAVAGRDLLEEMVEAMIASDHFRRRVFCAHDLSRPVFQPYLDARWNSARATLPRALATWAVLERIPTQWLPKEQVAKQTQRLLESIGIAAEVQVDSLMPPVPGGSAWVRETCAQGLNALAAIAPEAPEAIVLHWSGETRAVVVASDGNGDPRAFAPEWGAQGRPIPRGEDGLVGAMILPHAEPPVGWLYRLAGWLGLRGILWRSRRHWQLRKGLAQANVAI